jgi:hypothetical protein
VEGSVIWSIFRFKVALGADFTPFEALGGGTRRFYGSFFEIIDAKVAYFDYFTGID